MNNNTKSIIIININLNAIFSLRSISGDAFNNVNFVLSERITPIIANANSINIVVTIIVLIIYISSFLTNISCFSV